MDRKYIRRDKDNIIEDISDLKALVRLFVNYYSPSSFSWVFDFRSAATDFAKTDKDPEWHYYLKSKFSLGSSVNFY